MSVPVLPGLFDSPTTAQTNAERDQAIQRVAQKAEDVRPGFVEDACRFVLAYLESHGPTSGERLTLACKAAGIVPHDDRGFGAVYMTLSRRRLIESCGFVRRERGHGTAGGNVWKLAGK